MKCETFREAVNDTSLPIFRWSSSKRMDFLLHNDRCPACRKFLEDAAKKEAEEQGPLSPTDQVIFCLSKRLGEIERAKLVTESN